MKSLIAYQNILNQLDLYKPFMLIQRWWFLSLQNRCWCQFFSLMETKKVFLQMFVFYYHSRHNSKHFSATVAWWQKLNLELRFETHSSLTKKFDFKIYFLHVFAMKEILNNKNLGIFMKLECCMQVKYQMQQSDVFSPLQSFFLSLMHCHY